MPNVRNNRRLIMRRRVSGASLDADYLLWKAAVGTVGATQETATNALIVSLKAHSLWTVHDRIWISGENETQTRTDLKVQSVSTKSGSFASHVANEGYTGDGSSYLDLAFANGTNYTQNSASWSVYIRNSRSSGNNGTTIGSSDPASTGTNSLVLPLSGGQITWDVNDGEFTDQSANTNIQGFWTGSRTGSTALSLYKNSNSTAFATSSQVSSSLSGNVSFYAFARNSNGSASLHSTDQVSIFAFGAGLSGANAAQFQTDLNTYMTAFGKNVY